MDRRKAAILWFKLCFWMAIGLTLYWGLIIAGDSGNYWNYGWVILSVAGVAGLISLKLRVITGSWTIGDVNNKYGKKDGGD